MSLASIGDKNWDHKSSQSLDNKENVSTSRNKNGSAAEGKKLSPTWIFNAAMLSSPVNLEQLVTLSRDEPNQIIKEAGLLNSLVEKCLNAEAGSARVDKDTRLDVLAILSNIARSDDELVKDKVQNVLAGVSSWFEKYVEETEVSASREGKHLDPELHKAMLLLLSRAFSYSLKTENLLELCSGDRRLALESVVGILEDGEVLVTEIAPAQAPQGGQRGQWEQRQARIRHEKELMVQMCNLLLGFTRADTFFSELEEGFYFMEVGLELPEYCIEQFSVEMDSLLGLTMRTQLIEKLSVALNLEMFSDCKVLESSDHEAVIAINGFIQNLYLYGCDETESFRAHVLSDTLFVPHVVIPYLERCVYHAAVMTRKAAANRAALEDLEVDGFEDMPEGVAELVAEVSDLSLDYPELCHGVEATLRTLIICSFRAPRTRLMFQLLQRFNPTPSLLRMKSFVARHDYIFSLLLLLNVNMGAFDITAEEEEEEEEFDNDDDDDCDDSEDEKVQHGDSGCTTALFAYAMLSEVLEVYDMMSEEKQRRVLRRVEFSGALPVSRDCPSYHALLSLLWGGGNSGVALLLAQAAALEEDEEEDDDSSDDEGGADASDDFEDKGTPRDEFSETTDFKLLRADAKAEADARVMAKRDDDEMDKLCSEGASGCVAMKKSMAKSGKLLLGTQRRHHGMGETWAAELADMDDELERLDALVAADLRACQEDMWALEKEVTELRMHSGEPPPTHCRGDSEEEEDSEDDDEDISASEEDEDDESKEGKLKESAHGSPSGALTAADTLDAKDDGTPPSTKSYSGGGGGGQRSVGVVAAPGARAPPSTSSALFGSFGSMLGARTSNNGHEEQTEDRENLGDQNASDASSSCDPRSEAKGEVASSPGETKQRPPLRDRQTNQSHDATATPTAEAKETSVQDSPETKAEEKGVVAGPEISTLSKPPNGTATPSQDEDTAILENEGTAHQSSSKKKKTKKSKSGGRAQGKDHNHEKDVMKVSAPSRRSLLGDLPSLQKNKLKKEDLDQFLNLSLQVPNRKNDGASSKRDSGYLVSGSGGGGLLSPSGRRVNQGVPQELACAINGHLMKDPVRAPNGLVFERATILLWLERNGSVCPITGVKLVAADLSSDNELRTKILRRHIAKSMGMQQQEREDKPKAEEGSEELSIGASRAAGTTSALDDDLYDF